MTIRHWLTLLMLFPVSLVAADRSPSERFAAEMISCAYQHSTYGRMRGTVSTEQSAKAEATVYLAAAQKATSTHFVEAQTPILKKAAEESVMKAIAEAENVDVIIAKWNAVKATCDASLKSHSGS